MKTSSILYESLPMVRLGIRDEDQGVIVAPDFSTFAFMLEEYIARAASRIVICESSAEAKMLADLPVLLRKRVTLIKDDPEMEAANRLLRPVRAELSVAISGHETTLKFPKGMPIALKRNVATAHRVLVGLALGFNHGIQIGMSLNEARVAVRTLRSDLRNIDARAVLAQIEGILAAYEDVTFESPRPDVPSAPELVALFDRIVNDPDYLQLSSAVYDLAVPSDRHEALSRIRTFGHRLLTNRALTKGWNYVGNVLTAWTGVPVPEAETLLSFVSGKDLPAFVDLREARKRAVGAWLKSAKDTIPISNTGNIYEGISWVLPAAPPDEWDGGAFSTMTFGTVDSLRKELERFV